jgi:hypothetical protein
MGILPVDNKDVYIQQNNQAHSTMVDVTAMVENFFHTM